MKIKNLFILIVGTMLVISACSTLKVTSDYDKTVNFTQYKTFEYYGWADNSDDVLNRFDKERIEAAFGDEFKKRNLQYVEEGGDLIVSLYIVVEQKTQVSANTSGGYYGYGYGGYYGYGPGYGWGPGMTSSTTTYSQVDYHEGTLICSVYDLKEERLIWEGVASKTISENPQQREKNIPKVVAAIMARYPVKPLPQEK